MPPVSGNPVHNIAGTVVSVDTNVLFAPQKRLDRNGDGVVSRREAGNQWNDVVVQGQRIMLRRAYNRLTEGNADFARMSPEVVNMALSVLMGVKGGAAGAQAAQAGSFAGKLKSAMAAGAGQLRNAAILGAAIALVNEASSMYLEGESFWSLRTLNAGATIAYEAASTGVAGAAGVTVGTAVGTASSPFITPVGGAVVGFAAGAGTTYGAKRGLDWVKEETIQWVYGLFE